MVGRKRDEGNGPWKSVFIATPTTTHSALVAEFLERRIPIFCEKPFVTNVSDARLLQRLWEEAGKPKFLVDHQMLFDPRLDALPAPEHALVVAEGRGPVRPECSGIWDWGSHAVAEAMWIARSTDFELRECLWLWDPPHSNALTVDCSAMVGSTLTHLRFGNYSLQKLHAGRIENTVFYDAASCDQPPLTTAIKAFLDPTAFLTDRRFGMALPVAVTEFLVQVEAFIAQHIS